MRWGSLNADVLGLIYRRCDQPTQFMFRLASKRIYYKTESFNIEQLVKKCIELGYLNLLRWLKDKKVTYLFDTKIYFKAAQYGQLAILQWIKCYLKFPPFDVDALYLRAVQGGKIEIINWVNTEFGDPSNHMIASIFDYAICLGHISIMQFISTKGIIKNTFYCGTALQCEQIEAFTWLISHNFPTDDATTQSAIELGLIVNPCR